jgi:hypothetical protein
MKWVLVSAGVAVVAIGVIVIVAMSGGKDSAEATASAEQKPTTVPATTPASSATTAPADTYLGTGESMKRFFAVVPAAATSAAPSPETLVGKWHAKVVSLTLPQNESPIDPSESAGFDFEIVNQAGQFALRALDGKGQARPLVSDAQGVIAKAEGGADIRLWLQDQTLVGEMAIGQTGTASQGRMVFHATRIK